MKHVFSRVLTLLSVLNFLLLSVIASATANLEKVTINPSTVAGGQSATGTVTLSGTTTTALKIGLESSNGSYVTVPSSVTVPAGSSSCTFTIETAKVTQQATYGVYAVQDKIESEANITLAVDALQSVVCAPDFVAGGLPANVVVTLQAPAPAGGWPVTITANNSLVQCPTSCTVPSGSTTCTCCVVFQNTNSPCVVEISAKDSTGTKVSAQLDVNPLYYFNFDGPEGSPTTINGISNTNYIVGFCTPATTNENFVFTNQYTFLPISLGDPAGSLNAINTSQEGVGVANNTAFWEKSGTIYKIKVPNATSSVAFGVNDEGNVVGQYTLANGTTPGFVDINGTITTLLPKANATVVNPQGINNHGLVVGFYSINGVNQFPFTYNVSTKAYTFPVNPSTTRTSANGLVLTQFLGVNDSGIICGYYQTNNGSQYGLLYNTNSATYIYTDDPDAAPVNGVQITQLVGLSASTVAGFYIDGGGQMHGFFAK